MGDFRLTDLRLIAGGDHVADGQAALLHRHVDGDVGALGQDRDAFVDGAAAMLIGPDGDAVEGVDEAVAIGAEHRHVTSGAQKPGLGVGACVILGGAFGIAGGEANRAARIEFAQAFHRADTGFAIDADKGGVGDRW